ncbi:VanZ family protein [Thiogranum longum]|uniref:VanZ family protein n=1 Tax=Thiogranum longum TaxID=1537524 RepID=A0A4R1HG69_9GAMM|nr:VanZ family protein [Thiogranum longum]TCK19395.1 VanZ family protein [Thiogranum longum]
MNIHRLSLVLAVLWMGVLFWLSHQPSLDAPSLFSGQDKLFHAGAYGLLGILLLGAMRPDFSGYTGNQALFVAFVASVYGISDEFHQSFIPGRSPEVLDWVADSTGALLAALLLAHLTRTYSTRAS